MPISHPHWRDRRFWVAYTTIEAWDGIYYIVDDFGTLVPTSIITTCIFTTRNPNLGD